MHVYTYVYIRMIHTYHTYIRIYVCISGDTIIVELPQNSVVDFSTFVMDYTGATTNAGKAAAGPLGYVQTRFFPRNTASIIEQLDVYIRI
jgi:hypothetical protein